VGTVLELLHHMNTTYGSFTEAERRDVSSHMDVPWEGGPLETVIQQIQEASDAFGLGGAALSNNQMRDKLYDLVSTSNLLPEACQQWRMRNENDKTWDNACTHFQQFANDKDQVQTSAGAGFHANHVEMALAANTEALTDLNLQVANLSVKNATQAATILELTTRLATADASHQAYRDTVRRNRRSNNGSNEHNPPPAQQQGSGRAPKYCWTHCSCAHASANCQSQCDGHQATATLANRMGGSNLVGCG
jgi:hypothetical protein